MTYSDWTWLERFSQYGKIVASDRKDTHLIRMATLLKLHGNPQKGRLTVHVAGSKGKGSTCAFLASILNQAGYRTGLYASPHVLDYRERITLAGQFFEEGLYKHVLTSLRDWWKGLEKTPGPNRPIDPPPTIFEWLTLAAFSLFSQAGCNAQVIETGLGGRLDATNIVDPDAVVITPIEKEHTQILGNTLTAIATEKAGIIKCQCPVYSSEQHPEVLSVLQQTCELQDAPFYSVTELQDIKEQTFHDQTFLSFRFLDGEKLSCQLKVLGEVQGRNAALASLTADHLLKNFHSFSRRKIISEGLARTSLLGRFQKLLDKPPFFIDGAHTQASVNSLVKTWSKLFGNQGILIFGAFSDKNIQEMAQCCFGYFSYVIITLPSPYRSSDPQEMRQFFVTSGFLPSQLTICPQPEQALQVALSMSKPTLTCGSLYLAGKILQMLSQI